MISILDGGWGRNRVATWSEGCGKVRKRQKGDISTDNWSLATEAEREGDEEWGVQSPAPSPSITFEYNPL